MKKLLLGLMAIMAVFNATAQSVYDYSVKNGEGKEVSLAEYKGKVLLIVNTATRCGFTPQYKELEALYEKYHSKGLEILDFPCNQFGQQAPGSIAEIHQFCTANYDIHFTQFDKIDVNGQNAAPLYTYLKSEKAFSGFDLSDKSGQMMDKMMRKKDADYDKNNDIKWNFTKFLVSADGKVLKRYEPTDKISTIETDIEIGLNPVMNTIMARRSVRKYLDRPVEHEKLQAIAKAGIHAPSAMNGQQWQVRVVEDQQFMSKYKSMFRGAPNIICICTPTDDTEYNAGLLSENMMLAAQSMGLGTVCLGSPVRTINADKKFSTFLNRLDIPEGYQLSYIIAVGYPNEQPAAKPRDESKVKFIK